MLSDKEWTRAGVEKLCLERYREDRYDSMINQINKYLSGRIIDGFSAEDVISHATIRLLLLNKKPEKVKEVSPRKWLDNKIKQTCCKRFRRRRKMIEVLLELDTSEVCFDTPDDVMKSSEDIQERDRDFEFVTSSYPDLRLLREELRRQGGSTRAACTRAGLNYRRVRRSIQSARDVWKGERRRRRITDD
jgi:DNA-directed RNA polymerase specialized sigma24 family protein